MQAERYPLDPRSVGDDTYIVMSKGHHDPDAFMAAVRAEGYDWPLGKPEHKWVKATPCRCGEHTCHYTVLDQPMRGAFPATYAWEHYELPAASGVMASDAPSVTLSAEDAHFLAVRLRRLCAHLNYSLPKFADDDASLINIAGTVVGALLTNLTHGVPGTVNPACGVHGPIPCEGAQCICASGVAIPAAGDEVCRESMCANMERCQFPLACRAQPAAGVEGRCYQTFCAQTPIPSPMDYEGEG